MDKSKEKELEFGLKTTRLRMLALAGENIAEGENTTAMRWLLNFIDSVSSDSEPGKKMMEEYTKLTNDFNLMCERLYVLFDRASKGLCYDDNPCDGLPASEWFDRENKKALKKYVRTLHSTCWNVGNEWDLIPKE